MDPHDMEEREEMMESREQAGEERPEEEQSGDAPVWQDELDLDPENPVLSLLSTARTYALSRTNGGVLPKHMGKQASDVVDQAFSLGYVAFVSLETGEGKVKGLVLTDKGYDALARECG